MVEEYSCGIAILDFLQPSYFETIETILFKLLLYWISVSFRRTQLIRKEKLKGIKGKRPQWVK